MTATNGELVTQVRHLIDQAHQQGRHRPGRPTLVAFTGASDHEIRKALAELATEHTSIGEPTTRPADQANGDLADIASQPADTGGDIPPASPETTSVGDAQLQRRPPGGRLVAWTGFVFGSIMSIAANVLHAWLPADHHSPSWTPGIPPQIGAAVWPIGLMLAVEALSRIHWPTGPGWGLARYGGAGTVALGSATISYGHLRDLLLAWHYGPPAAAVGPLVLDGLMVVCGFALLANSLTNTGDTTRDAL